MIFRKELAELILDGKKTATRRAMSDNPRSPWWKGGCSYSKGQVFAVQNGRGKVAIAEATITDIYADAPILISHKQSREEGFANPDAFLTAFQKINPTAPLYRKVWVIEFAVNLNEIERRRKNLKRFTTYRAARAWSNTVSLPIDYLDSLVKMGFLTKETFKMHDKVSYQLTKAGKQEAAKVEAAW